jgi:NADH-quinone oxidoreductase subunit L
VPNGTASLAADVARGAVRIQTGRVANYAFVMIAGLAVFVTLLAFGAAR